MGKKSKSGDKSNSIEANIIYSTLYRVLLIIAPLITAPYTARIFGADGIGVYSYTNSIVSYFTMFAALGTATYGQREIARHRDEPEVASKLFWEIELLSVLSTLVCLALWIVFVLISNEYNAYYAVLSLSVLAIAFDISWYYAGYERFKFVFLRNSVVRIVGIIILFTCVKKKEDLLLYVALLSATGLIGNITMWTYLPKMLVKVKFSELKILRHFRQTLVYFIPTIATSIYNLADRTMLGIITKNAYENGYYEQAHKILAMAKSLLFSLNSVLSSRMTYLFKNSSKEVFRSRLRFIMMANMFFAIPMCFGIIGISNTLVPAFFGDGYDKVVGLLCVTSTLLVIIGISNCLEQQYYTPSGKRKQSNKYVISGAVTNLFLNMLMIPKFGSYGACIASVAAECVVTFVYVRGALAEISVGEIWKCSYRYLISGVIMAAIVFGVGAILDVGYFGLGVQVFVGVVAYFLLLLIMREELMMFGMKKYIISRIKK